MGDSEGILECFLLIALSYRTVVMSAVDCFKLHISIKRRFDFAKHIGAGARLQQDA